MKLPSLLPALGALRGRRPRSVAVREAWLDPERYAGQTISLVGTVRAFDTDTPVPYYTLDDGPNRVGLRGDDAALAALVGRTVRATGTLTFRPGVGIFLEVATIAPTRRR